MSRNFHERLLFLVWLVVLTVATVARADAQAVRGIDSVAVTVSDMERSLDFYTHVLPFERVASREETGDDYEHLYGV
ncbi:MAG TPA: VOC family protein, partial [Steroidobacteraceae bacterium]